MFEIDIKEDSPFQPGNPVFPDNFKGRKKSIEKILRYVNKASKGDSQHFFITGTRGMGKTSLANFVEDVVRTNWGMIGVYVSNKGNDSIETLVNMIFEKIFNEIPKDSVINKIKNWFGEHIESVEIKGTKLKFKADNYLANDMVNNFPYYLNEIYKELPNEEKGIFLIIDDINGLSESKKFVDWYKSFADTIAVDKNYNIPLYLLLASYPEKFDKLVLQEESFGRIFNFENLNSLSDEEVKEFFIDTFNNINMVCDEEALKIMTTFSSGLPLMMQQIGDSVFWLSDSNNITKDIAYEGVINAANEIGSKQIRPVLNQIKSENYEPILMKLANNKANVFKKSEFRKYLSKSEEKVFTDFLSRMVELGILNSIGRKNSGEYEFNNKLYFTYFLIKSLENELNNKSFC